jgi:uncharacterized repeat protein (TIGR02543 family)
MIGKKELFRASVVVFALAVSTLGFEPTAEATPSCTPSVNNVDTVNNVHFDVLGDCTAVVTGLHNSATTTLQIPRAVSNGVGSYSVTAIGTGAFQTSNLVSVDLSGATALTSIGQQAFDDSGSLITLTLPTSLQSIGEAAFDSIGITNLDLSTLTALTTIGVDAFRRNQQLVNVTLPSSLLSLGDRSFKRTVISPSVNIQFRGSLPAGTVVDPFDSGAVLSYCGAPVTWDSFYSVQSGLCVLAFSTQEGSAVPAQLATYGGQFIAPTAPTRPGYVFSGWVTNAGASTPFAFPASATANQIAYATWTVAPSPSPSASASPADAATDSLASTGGSTAELLVFSMVLLLLGGLITVASRQRRS